MNRRVLEVADLLGAAGDAFIERSCVCGRTQAGLPCVGPVRHGSAKAQIHLTVIRGPDW